MLLSGIQGNSAMMQAQPICALIKLTPPQSTIIRLMEMNVIYRLILVMEMALLQEAIDACNHLNMGDSCSFDTPNGMAFDAHRAQGELTGTADIHETTCQEY